MPAPLFIRRYLEKARRKGYRVTVGLKAGQLQELNLAAARAGLNALATWLGWNGGVRA